MPYRKIVRSLFCAVALLGAACGENNEVGDESLLDFKSQANNRLGERTTTTMGATTTAPPTTAATGAKAGVGQATTTAPPTTARPAQTLDIAIHGDNAGTTQFDPSAARVFKGTVVRWTNKDTVPRSVESDDNTTFASPPIPPGGSYSWTATAPGKFNYTDGTRPYAVASLEVLNR